MDIDGISAVLGAIAASASAGAGAAIKDMTKSAIVESRDRLVTLVRRRLTKDQLGDAKLTVYSAEPTPTNGQALHGHLVDAGIDQDEEILTLARDVLAAAGPAALAPGSVAANVIHQINRDGGMGFIGGQHVHHHRRASMLRVSWELLQVSGSLFELRNEGDTSAHEVEVTAENAARFDPPSPGGEWGPGSGREFLAVGSLQTGHPIITVTWRNDVGERQTWTRPLPR